MNSHSRNGCSNIGNTNKVKRLGMTVSIWSILTGAAHPSRATFFSRPIHVFNQVYVVWLWVHFPPKSARYLWIYHYEREDVLIQMPLSLVDYLKARGRVIQRWQCLFLFGSNRLSRWYLLLDALFNVNLVADPHSSVRSSVPGCEILARHVLYFDAIVWQLCWSPVVFLLTATTTYKEYLMLITGGGMFI